MYILKLFWLFYRERTYFSVFYFFICSNPHRIKLYQVFRKFKTTWPLNLRNILEDIFLHPLKKLKYRSTVYSKDHIFKTRGIRQAVNSFNMEGHRLHTSVSNRTMKIHDCPKINPHQKITFLTMLFLLQVTAMQIAVYHKETTKRYLNITLLISGKWWTLILFSNYLNLYAENHKYDG